MKTPRFTDLHRFPHGYTHSKATDVAKTFARVRREMAKSQAEAAKKTNVKKLERKVAK